MAEMLSGAIEQLLGRASGPLHLRLVIMPIVATILAIRAGLKDARTGQPAFLWAVVTSPAERRRLLHSGWKDIGRMLIIALVIDAVYQVMMFRAFHVVQALIVAVVLAMVPYVLIRGPINRVARGLARMHGRSAEGRTAAPTQP
jgi:hypothetical protein